MEITKNPFWLMFMRPPKQKQTPGEGNIRWTQ